MNLLDYAAVAVPSGFMGNGLPWGVTLFGRAFTDQYLLSVAAGLQRQQGSTDPAPTTVARNDRARLVVCGAHLDGLALNWQLKRRGARLVETTQSSPDYQLYALAGGPPFRPGMVRVHEGGVAIAVEVWELPSSRIGLVPDRHSGAAGPGQSATGGWSLGERFYLRGLWVGGCGGHQSFRRVAGLSEKPRLTVILWEQACSHKVRGRFTTIRGTHGAVISRQCH